PVSSRCGQASAGDHRSVLNQTVEYKSNAQSVIISGFQLSAILRKTSPAKAADPPNPHRQPTAHRLPAGSFFGGFPTPAHYTGSIARAGPASETLHESGPSLKPRDIGRVRPEADTRYALAGSGSCALAADHRYLQPWHNAVGARMI